MQIIIQIKFLIYHLFRFILNFTKVLSQKARQYLILLSNFMTYYSEGQLTQKNLMFDIDNRTN